MWSELASPAPSAPFAAITGAGLWLLTAVAAAHPSFDQASVPASSTQRLQLSVPVESDDTAVRNQEIDLHLPAGFAGRGCVPALGWSCEVDDSDPTDVVVRWTEVGGLVRPETFDLFVQTPSALRTYAFIVVQERSDFSVIRWDDPPTGLHPAPRLRVTGADSAAEPNTSPPPSHAPTTTVVDPGPPATTTQAPPPTAAAGQGAAGTTSTSTSTTAASSTTAPTTVTTMDIPEPGEEDAIAPGDVTLSRPDADAPEPASLSPARVAVGLAGAIGALLIWLLVRRANQPT